MNSFKNKVDRIVKSIVSPSDRSVELISPPVDKPLEQFRPVNTDDVLKLVNKSPTKSSACDPMPTWLLKLCPETVIPYIARIINSSIGESTFPDAFKSAIITPILKKQSLDQNDLANYRPISNLSFISKVLEKVVLSQINEHLEENNLCKKIQSAYRPNHSTETALLRVQNDILSAIDDGNIVLLLMIDLSAAFDLVNHDILLARLETKFGITLNALAWIRSYLSGRSQKCVINGESSSPVTLSRGVPQGSVLGPVLFSLFTAPLGDIAKKHNMERHFYADDMYSQFYLRFKIKNAGSDIVTVNACAADIKSGWHLMNSSLTTKKPS